MLKTKEIKSSWLLILKSSRKIVHVTGWNCFPNFYPWDPVMKHPKLESFHIAQHRMELSCFGSLIQNALTRIAHQTGQGREDASPCWRVGWANRCSGVFNGFQILTCIHLNLTFKKTRQKKFSLCPFFFLSFKVCFKRKKICDRSYTFILVCLKRSFLPWTRRIKCINPFIARYAGD